MVVTHTTQPTSATTPTSAPRKTRRGMTRKTPRTADPAAKGIDADENMNDAAITLEAGSSTSSQIAAPKSAGSVGVEATADDGDDDLMIDTDPSSLPHPIAAPAFSALPAGAGKDTLKSELRRIAIPPHRMTPLKKDWVNIFGPLTEILGLQVRMNVQRKCVEARVCFLLVFVWGLC